MKYPIKKSKFISMKFKYIVNFPESKGRVTFRSTFLRKCEGEDGYSAVKKRGEMIQPLSHSRGRRQIFQVHARGTTQHVFRKEL